MNEKEEEAIEFIKNLISWDVKQDLCPNKEECEKLETVLNLIEKLQKENEELKTELERQKDINSIINQKGLEKNYEKALEKTMTKFLKNNIDKDFIPVQKVKDIIERIDYDITKTKKIISDNSTDYSGTRKNEYQIVRLKAMNTKSLDIKNRLQELIEEREEK